MKISKSVILLAVLMCLSFLLTGCRLYTVVKHDKGGAGAGGTKFYFEDESFDADAFVTSIWDSRIIPQMDKKAVQIAEVLKELKTDGDGAGKKYGIRSSEVGSAWNFIVKGKGKVLKVNTESRNGTVDVDLEPYDGNKDIAIQIGPVFKGTSIRDSMDFIKFDDFKNQMVFASVSSSLNKYIRDKVVNTLQPDSMGGQEIEFVGAFTLEAPDNIVVTPVEIVKAGGGN